MRFMITFRISAEKGECIGQGGEPPPTRPVYS
jgi:hypothetical protein